MKYELDVAFRKQGSVIVDFGIAAAMELRKV